jgi:L-iditol 2-dehydrogenase
LAEPLACGWHAVRLSGAAIDVAMADARCLVIGGGAIGTGAALALRAFGAVQIEVVEPNDLRRATLDQIEGFTALKEASGLYDIVVDAVGYAATRADASAFARPGGVIAHIGLGEASGGLDIRRMTLQEITFFGTYTYTADDFRATAEAIFDGRFGALDWITTRPLADGQQAFLDIRSGQVAAPKIILIPDHEE